MGDGTDNRRAARFDAAGTRLEGEEPALRPAAVLVPVYRDEEDRLRLVLVRRTAGGVHGGQLALPGGKLERDDRSLVDAAMREAHEEIGLEPERVSVITSLPEVDTWVSGFVISPFLAKIARPVTWRRSPLEIDEVLEVAVDDLLRPGVHESSLERFPGWPEPRLISYYRINQHRLWGATYRIVHPLLPRLVAGEWPL